MVAFTSLAPRELRATHSARFFTGARPQRAWISCQAQPEHGAAQAVQAEVSRRATLLGAVTLALPLLTASAAQAAENKEVTRGLSVYIRKKKYDAIDTYLPPLLAARGQLIRSGYLLVQDPASARLMLREGAFTGLRDNVRAVGEYAGQHGQKEEGAQRVAAFFKALEAYDYTIFQLSRGTNGYDAEGGQKQLNEAAEALDRLLELVPNDAMTKARQIIDDLEAEVESEREMRAAEQQLREQQELEKLL